MALCGPIESSTKSHVMSLHSLPSAPLSMKFYQNFCYFNHFFHNLLHFVTLYDLYSPLFPTCSLGLIVCLLLNYLKIYLIDLKLFWSSNSEY